MPKSGIAGSNTFFQSDFGSAGVFEFLTGRIAVYTRRAPDKESPNEDAIGIFALNASAGVLVIADGVGGAPSGEQASRVAVEMMAKSLRTTPAGSEENLRDYVLDGFEAANREIVASTNGGATTMALVEVQGNTIRSYHVGDSVVLVLGQRGKIKLQTVSHSPVGYAMESGLIPEEEALQHEDRHLVSNVLGSADMRLEIGGAFKLAPRDTVIIASDGLVDNLSIPEIVGFARKGPLGKVVQTLVDACHARMMTPEPGQPSHMDDLSILAFRLKA